MTPPNSSSNAAPDSFYRDNAKPLTCATCGDPGLLCCPQCERPFCASHAGTSGPCADCAANAPEQGRLEKAGLILLTGGTLAGTALAAVGVAFGSMLLIPSTILAGSALAISGFRSRKQRQLRSWIPVENSRLAIGPRTESEAEDRAAATRALPGRRE